MDDEAYLVWMATRTEAIDKLPNPDGLKTTELRECVSVFTKNAREALELCEVAFRFSWIGQYIKMADVAASMMLFGEPCFQSVTWPLWRGQPFANAELANEYHSKHKAHRKLYEDILAGNETPPFQINSGVNLEDVMKHATPIVRQLLNSLMAAQVVLAWSAFETLAGDLWEVALNTDPSSLATRAAESLESKSISIEYLSKRGFNLADAMGTVLRADLGNPFQSAKAIADSYMSTFPRGSVSKRDFWKDKSFLSTAAIRNLIVHRAGVVDEQFRDQCKGDDRFASWRSGDRLALDGFALQDLLRDFFHFSRRLVNSVDGCLYLAAKKRDTNGNR